MSKQHQILVIGGGNAGVSVAARLKKANRSLQVTILDPSSKHYYQPAWTLVGGGEFDINDTVRNQKDVMPKGVEWLQVGAAKFNPEENTVIDTEGNEHVYDYMVVCPGIQLNWDWVEGLKETIGKNQVCSNYLFEQAPYTWKTLRNFKGGTALFTNPSTPVKCGGAPQKIMYLGSDYLQRNNLLSQTSVEFCSAGGVIFGIQKYKVALEKVCKNYGIKLNFKYNLVAIDGPNHIATFEVTDPSGTTSLVKKEFDMIHVTPPQSAPDFIRFSPLAISNTSLPEGTPCTPDNATNQYLGWMDIDKFTLQHNKYPNVFGLGDAGSTPNAKTGAAVRKQAPVVVENLLAAMKSSSLNGTYNGYGSCPLITGKGRLILAEFDYNNEPMETFPFDQVKERWSMYMLKKKVLPWLYWNKILSGKHRNFKYGT